MEKAHASSVHSTVAHLDFGANEKHMPLLHLGFGARDTIVLPVCLGAPAESFRRGVCFFGRL